MVKEIISIICTILSAFFAVTSFTFYKKTVNLYGDNINQKKSYKKIKQESGDKGINNIGDNNKF